MKKKMLFVFAHPDDESFLVGGTIAHYRTKNVEIHLFCATKGGAGKTGNPPLCTKEELPAVREQELRNAASILGVDDIHLRDYQDGKLSEAPYRQIYDDVLALTNHIQPQIMITFPPHGVSGHKDHIFMQKLCIDLVRKNHIPGLDALLYATRLQSESQPTSPFGNRQSELDIILDTQDTVQQVAEALKAHKSQHLSVERVFPGIDEGRLEGIPRQNYFMIAWESERYRSQRMKHQKPYSTLFF